MLMGLSGDTAEPHNGPTANTELIVSARITWTRQDDVVLQTDSSGVIQWHPGLIRSKADYGAL